MTVTDGPAQLDSLATILGSAAAWVAAGSSAADVYWPVLDPATDIAANPSAEVELTDSRTARVVIYALSSYTEQALADLANDLRFQLPTRYRTNGTGLFIAVDPEVGDVMESSDGMEAGTGLFYYQIEMTLRIGVDQE